MNETALFLDKAERSLRAAQSLAEEGYLDFAASRAYYACFYVAEGLLLSLGLEFSRHGQVIAQYGYHFARNRLLDPAFHELLSDSFSLRHSADYESSADIDLPTVTNLLREGRGFLEAARAYLEAHPPAPQT